MQLNNLVYLNLFINERISCYFMKYFAIMCKINKQCIAIFKFWIKTLRTDEELKWLLNIIWMIEVINAAKIIHARCNELQMIYFNPFIKCILYYFIFLLFGFGLTSTSMTADSTKQCMLCY